MMALNNTNAKNNNEQIDTEDEEDTISIALQEALGVTPKGTCIRHPNCPVMHTMRVMSCRVCFSEEKSAGIQQRKSFAAVVQQLQRMTPSAATVSAESTKPKAESKRSLEPSSSSTADDEDDDDGPSASNTATSRWGDKVEKTKEPTTASSFGSNVLHQPQSLESLMKRLAQVQNWMLRQKEKEVLSLQLHIQRLENRMTDMEKSDVEQKQTIRALRRTIQQDLKIIKTMALQKERESSHHPTATTGGAGDSSEDDPSESAYDEFALESPKKQGKNNEQMLIIVDDGMTSPSKRTVNRTMSAPVSASEEADEDLSPDRTPSPSRRSPMKARLNRLKQAGGGTGARGEPRRRAPGRAYSMDLSVHSIPEDTPDEKEIFVPASERSSYWTDEDLSLASNPTKLFASFRGGLLDIPKSPPKGRHDTKTRAKLQLDAETKAALKLPSMRSLTNSANPSFNEKAPPALKKTLQQKKDIPLDLLASRLQALPLATPTETPEHADDPKKKAEMSVEQKKVMEMSLLDSSSEDTFPKDKQAAAPAILLPAVPPPPPVKTKAVLPSLDKALPSLKGATPQMNNISSLTMDTGIATKATFSSPAKSSLEIQPALEENDDDAEESNDQTAANDSILFTVTDAACQDKYGDPGFYTGTILVTQGLPHGKGSMNYESGRVYSGDWKSGQWNGKGKLLNPNGDSYEGDFILDARHGHGVYKWDNNDVYEGEFSQDKRHGKGTFSFHNGNVYKGEFVDGMFDGFGRYEFGGGSYEGEWKQGRYEGEGELKYAMGGKYIGEFRNSVAHGFGMELTADGHKRRGVWHEGEPVEYFERS